MRLDFTPRRLFFPDQVTILNLTPEQAAKLAENQAKFNTEISKTEDLLDNVQNIIGTGITNDLRKALKEARGLNVEYGRGENIVNKLKKATKESAKELEELYYQRNRNLATLSKAEALEANRQLDARIKVLESIDAQIRFLQASLEEEKRITEEKKKQNSLSGFAKKKYEEIGKEFEKFFSFATLFKAIIDSALRFNKISTDIGKSLGYGTDKANDIASNMADTANAAFNVNMTLANMGEAANQLSEATGLVANYSNDALETQIKLTKQFGLTGEEAAGIYKFSLLTGKSSEQVNDEMVGAFVAARNASKAGIPFKATMAEAAKVSGALASNLQNNPTAIVKAVVATKALGSSLEQAAKQGEALLDFESSLENELKAELLTGKQLNLERARAAALAGNQVVVAEELNKQVGSLEEFDRMNVLQKKAIAAAVGLTTDELANQLRQQREAIKNGESLEQLTKREALEAQERQNIQDKFNQAVLKLQDFFGNLVAGPLGKFLEILTEALPLITSISSIFLSIYTINKGIALLEKLKLGYAIGARGAELGKNGILLARQALLRGELAKSIGIAVSQIAGSSAVSFGIAAAVALAAGAAAYSFLSSKKGDDVISEGGYGKRTLLAPEGAIKLNDKDTVIAGTDLGGGGGGGSIDLTPMIAAINEVKAAVNQLMNRPVIINMDSKQVGSSLVQASPKSA